MRRSAIVLLVVVVLLCGCQAKTEKLTIFNAGSLTIPLKEVNEEFKKVYPNVDFRMEPSGSLMAVRKVTDLGRRADVVAVADYTLLRDFVYPKYADFYIAFAKNELVICYTNKSRYGDEINSSNWFEVLSRKDVKLGFSNPNIDPCGYRSVMAMKLADFYYGRNVFQNLIEKHTNIRAEGSKIVVPKDVETDGKVVVRDKSVDLIALLESGSIDYAFEYKSVALQHGLKFVELPDEINLGNFSLGKWYGRVSIVVWKGEDRKEIKAKPIIYGVTIPKNAENREIAEKYLAFLLTKGREIFKRYHQEFLEEPLGFGKIPDSIKRYVKVV